MKIKNRKKNERLALGMGLPPLAPKAARKIMELIRESKRK